MVGVAIAVSVLTLLGSAGGPSGDGPAAAGVRPVDERSIALVAAARAQSPTIRALVDELARSDVVVYVRFSVALRPPRATTNLVNATGALRYLAIALSYPNPEAVAIEMLGHELAHAVEIAGNKGIRSQTDLAAYYRSAGRESTGARGFDTSGAVSTQRRIRREIG